MLYFWRMAATHCHTFWITHQHTTSKTCLKLLNASKNDIRIFKNVVSGYIYCLKFYSTVGWPQCGITHHNLKKLDELSRTCDSAWPPFFRNIAPWYFNWHFYTNQDIAISKKKLIPPTSGIPKRLRMSKSVKNCGNVNFFIYSKLKKRPV